MTHRWCALWFMAAGAGLTQVESSWADELPTTSDLLACQMVWAGGEGLWSNPALWTLTCTPGDDNLEVIIDARPAIASLVHLDTNAVIGNLIVQNGDALWFQTGRTLSFSTTLPQSMLHNSGLVRLAGGGAGSDLIVATPMLAISGQGTLELAGLGARVSGIADASWIFNVDQTIRGTGALGSGTTGLVNYSTIQADLPEQTLRVHPSSVLGCWNPGTMRATGQGRLRLIGPFDNQSGQILAVEGGRVDLDNASITGGELVADDASVIIAAETNASLRDVQLAGSIQVGNVQLAIRGTIANSGDILLMGGSEIADSGSFSMLAVPPGSGDALLTGPGALHLIAGQVGSGSTAIGGRLIHDTAHRIQGWGPLGLDTIGLVNRGLIVADQENPIVIDPADSDEAVNEGTVRAIGAGGVVFTDGVFRNDGIVEALPASKAVFTASAVEQNASGGVIWGGTWKVIADDAPAFILIPGPGAVYNFGSVILSGPQSGFGIINQLSINTGRFEIRNGRDFTSSQALFSNSGELAVGRFSTLTLNGTLTQESGATLELTVAPENVGQEWRVAVAGTAMLSGTLTIVPAAQFQPQQGQTFQLLTASAITGTFNQIVAPPGFVVMYGDTSVQCVYMAPCIGDVNGDGLIDVLDLIAILNSWGSCPEGASLCIGDVNGDGVVNLADLLALMNSWGECP